MSLSHIATLRDRLLDAASRGDFGVNDQVEEWLRLAQSLQEGVAQGTVDPQAIASACRAGRVLLIFLKVISEAEANEGCPYCTAQWGSDTMSEAGTCST